MSCLQITAAGMSMLNSPWKYCHPAAAAINRKSGAVVRVINAKAPTASVILAIWNIVLAVTRCLLHRSIISTHNEANNGQEWYMCGTISIGSE